jgi:hypothetical protein
MTMVYLMAMRLFSPSQGRGVNVYPYLPKAPPKPGNVWSLADAPGPVREDLLWREITAPPSGTSVEAFLDLILRDQADYSPELIKKALAEVERRVAEGQPNPAKLEVKVGKTTVYAVFSVNLGLADLPKKLRVLGELRQAIERWGTVHGAKIGGARAKAGTRRAVG